MGQEETEIKLTRRERRLQKNIKRIKRKSTILIVILTLLIGYLIFYNYRAYQDCTRMSMQLSAVQNKHQSQTENLNNLKTRISSIVEGEHNYTENSNTTATTADTDVKKLNDKINTLEEENLLLKQSNKELIEDNIHYQNSIKLAALAGVKPKNYERPPAITSRNGVDRQKYLGKFKVTAYTPSVKECGNNKGITYSGKPIIPGTTVAVDTKYWPIGTIFYIKGIGYVTAMDTGGKVKGKNRFDFAVFDRKFAFTIGTRYWDVYLVKMGNGKVDTGFFSNS